MWPAWINGSMGLWLIVTAFFRANRADCLIYNLVAGILVAIVGWRMKADKPWQGWLSVVMGLWVLGSIAIPLVHGGNGFLWNNVVSGMLVAVLGFTALGGGTQ